jgi:OPA family glycerol-3-phosphate transporter-like MFS transporter
MLAFTSQPRQFIPFLNSLSLRGSSRMGLVIVAITILLVIALYFRQNPMGHSTWFMIRRFMNWFPLGMSYAFLYMARYNLNVSKNALGSMMTKESFGLIFAAGTITYALSFFLTGPLVDKIGGRRGILIATLGSAAANTIMGVYTYLYLRGQIAANMTVVFSVLYSINMFFQSYGGVSIIKVKAYWFHVRERGIFSGIFGTLISVGMYLAFDWGHAIAEASKARVQNPNFLQTLFNTLFGTWGRQEDSIWLVFFIPALLLVVWAVIDYILIRDTPAQAGLADFDTHDASSGEMHIEYSIKDLIYRVITSPILLMIAMVEFTTGVVRNGIVQWYYIFADEVKQPGSEFFFEHWGLMLCIGGILGGFSAGFLSDKIFQSRRGPPVVVAGGLMSVALLIMTLFLFKSAVTVGVCSVLIGLLTISIHSLMSGTAAADFGGRKMTATAAGITDAFVYLGSGLQSLSLGYLISNHGWKFWPAFLFPFAILGIFLAKRMWTSLPAATRRYLLTIEKIGITVKTERV